MQCARAERGDDQERKDGRLAEKRVSHAWCRVVNVVLCCGEGLPRWTVDHHLVAYRRPFEWVGGEGERTV